MARMEIKGLDEYAMKLSKLGTQEGDIAKKAVYGGASIVADEVRSKLEALPEDRFRKLKPEETFTGVPHDQKKDLIDALGVAGINTDKDGNTNTKIGFDGYGSYPTKSYPQGVPNPLLARAVESGSSVRKKTPFVRPAVNATKKPATAKMGAVIDEEIQKLMK